MPKDRWILGLFGSTLLVSLFWGLLGQLDPFGIKSAAALHSESIFMRIIGAPWYQSAAQDDITVVLIDDNYLEEIGLYWPMPYYEQEWLLSNILAFEPRAVFLDLLYRHKHEEADDSVQLLLDTISQTGEDKPQIPIFIPYLIEDRQGINTCNGQPDNSSTPPVTAGSMVIQDSVIKEFRESNTVKTYVGWAGCNNRYPSYILQDSNYKTPAFALFERSCNGDSQKTTHFCQESYSGNSNDFIEPMVINWGAGVSTSNQAALENENISCTPNPVGLYSKFKYSATQLYTSLRQSLSSNPERGTSEQCPYTDTVHATWFLGSSPKTHAYLEEMLRDRIVLVGTKLDAIHDYIISPVHGQVPGVYLFAMALDNYLTYGTEYFKEMNTKLAILIELFVLFSISFGMGVLSKYNPVLLWDIEKTAGNAHKVRKIIQKAMSAITLLLLYKLIIPVAMSFLFAFIMWKCRFAPMDWIGVSFLSIIANPVTLKNCLELTQLQKS